MIVSKLRMSNPNGKMIRNHKNEVHGWKLLPSNDNVTNGYGSQNDANRQKQNGGSRRRTNYSEKGIPETPKELIDSPDLHMLIDMHEIRIHDKNSEKYPEVIYECCVCKNFTCNDVFTIEDHINSTNHTERLQNFFNKNMARDMPYLTKIMANSISNVLQDVYNSEKMGSEDLSVRNAFCEKISAIVAEKVEGCTLTIYGSTLYCMGIKGSDLNLMLKAKTERDCRIAMHYLISRLQGEFMIEFNENGDGTISKLILIDYSRTNFKCEILPNSIASIHLTKLISKYIEIDPRATKLMCLFRYWGKVCGIDQPTRGTFPGFAFYLMVIYYLQQCEPPVLPVLQEDAPVLFEDHNFDRHGPTSVHNLLPTVVKENKESLASLWVKMFKFFGFNFNSKVIQIHQRKPLLRKDHGWNGLLMKFAIADPFSPKKNLTKCINNMKTVLYIEECLQTTWKYFSIPQTSKGPIIGGIIPDPPILSCRSYPPKFVDCYNKYIDLMSRFVELIVAKDDGVFNNPSRSDRQQHHKDIAKKIAEIQREAPYRHGKQLPCALNSNIDNAKDMILPNTSITYNTYSKLLVYRSSAEYMFSRVNKDRLRYAFSFEVLTNCQLLPLMCKRCEKEGHVSTDCPWNQIPQIEKLPETNAYTVNLINRLCHHLYECNKTDHGLLEMKNSFVSNMEQFLKKNGLDVRLKLFGSSVNGFGFNHSDTDISATFDGVEYDDPKVIDRTKLIKDLHSLLLSYHELVELNPITTAKVPIIKFKHKNGLEGDISFYNELAVENTDLLRAYASIDERVPMLVFMIKKFASVCNIGHAAKGGLSSYGYTLMVIFYLQRCNPPVLPVLQEISKKYNPNVEDVNGIIEKKRVEGKYVCYIKDISSLDRYYNFTKKNQQSVGELWLGLLKYYTEVFDLKHHVISIGFSDLVTKDSLSWTTSNISILDPFDDHNIGSALSSNMNIYIIKQLIGARTHFCTNREKKPELENDEELMKEFFIDYNSQEDPPTDRRCLICKTIGHMARACPQQKSTKKGGRVHSKSLCDDSESASELVNNDDNSQHSENDESENSILNTATIRESTDIAKQKITQVEKKLGAVSVNSPSAAPIRPTNFASTTANTSGFDSQLLNAPIRFFLPRFSSNSPPITSHVNRFSHPPPSAAPSPPVLGQRFSSNHHRSVLLNGSPLIRYSPGQPEGVRQFFPAPPLNRPPGVPQMRGPSPLNFHSNHQIPLRATGVNDSMGVIRHVYPYPIQANSVIRPNQLNQNVNRSNPNQPANSFNSGANRNFNQTSNESASSINQPNVNNNSVPDGISEVTNKIKSVDIKNRSRRRQRK